MGKRNGCRLNFNPSGWGCPGGPLVPEPRVITPLEAQRKKERGEELLAISRSRIDILRANGMARRAAA